MKKSKAKPYVFLSYSGRSREEKRVVRRLLARLGDQALDVWIYESPEGAIPIGFNIQNFCSEKIDNSSLVVILVSDSTLKSEWTLAELEHAQSTEKNIWGVSLQPYTLSQKQWPSAYLKLRKSIQLSIDLKSTKILEQIESVVESICSSLKIAFRDDEVDERFPLAQKLCEELWGIPINSAFEISLYRDLRLYSFSCVMAYQRGDHNTACSLAEGISSDIANKILPHLSEKESLSFPNYYPRLIVAVISSQTGMASGLLKAREIVADLRSEFLNYNANSPEKIYFSTDSRWPDENLLALIGIFHLQDGEPGKAQKWYQAAWNFFEERKMAEARDYCTVRDVNIDVALGLLHCSLFLHESFDEEVETRFLKNCLEHGFNAKSYVDVRQLAMLTCIQFTKTGKLIDFHDLVQIGFEWWSDILVAFLNWLANQADNELREQGLYSCCSNLLPSILTLPKPLSKHEQAVVASIANALDLLLDYHVSLRLFDSLLESFETEEKLTPVGKETDENLPFLLQMSQFYYYWGHERRMRRSCQILAVRAERLDKNNLNQRCFYRGFSLWLLGKRREGLVDFEASGAEHKLQYDKLMNDCSVFKRFLRKRNRHKLPSLFS